MTLEEIYAYDGQYNMYVNSKVDGVNMNYIINLYISRELVVKMKGASYKTSRQRNFNHINNQQYRGTFDEKRESYFKQIKQHIPTDVINFAMQKLLESIKIEPWEVEL